MSFGCFNCHTALKRASPGVAQVRFAQGSQWFVCTRHALDNLHTEPLRGMRPVSEAWTVWRIR